MTTIQKLTITIRKILKNNNNVTTIQKLKPLLYSQQIDWKIYKDLINLHQEKLDSRDVITYYKDFDIKKVDVDRNYYYKMKLPYTDESDIFGLYLIKWLPFSRTLIHNHEDLECLFKVMEGEVEENVYDSGCWGYLLEANSYQSKQEKSEEERNDIAYIDDNIGLHSMQNITEYDTYSLHLYSSRYQS